MRYLLKILLTSVFVASLLDHISLAAGARLPQRHASRAKRIRSPKSVDVKGLDVLRTYVCPPCANAVRRQIDVTSGTISVAIPVTEIQQLWTELQWILAQLGAILEAEGLLDAPAVAGGAISALPTVPILAGSDPSSTLTFQIPAMPSSVIGTPALMTDPIVTNPAPFPSQVVTTPLITVTVSTTPPGGCGGTVTVEETIAVEPTPAMTDNVAAFSTADSSLAIVNTMASVAAISSATSTPPPPSAGIFFATSVSNGSSTIQTPSQPTIQSNASVSSYVFDAQSAKNIAVYFGQTPVTGGTTLEAQCADPNIDIAVLAFVISANYQSKYPSVNFGAACGGQTDAMKSQAPGLLSCPELAGYIKTCQETYGKKVLLGIGGAVSNIIFENSTQAVDFGNVLWDLFGPPGNVDGELRPFGNVTVDGFDIDNEDKHPDSWDILTDTLRSNYATLPSKTFYLSSAPQCPFPDQSDPLPLLQNCDFVFVQFYNNPGCQIGDSGFNASIQNWSSELAKSTRSPKPKLFLGAPAWSEAGPAAYASIGTAEGMESLAKEVAAMRLSNFGGVMFWDGPEGQLNEEGGMDIIGWAKKGLGEA